MTDLFGEPVGGGKMWTTLELASAGNVSIGRIRQLIYEGRFPNVMRVGGKRRGFWLVPDGDALRWLHHDRDRRRKAPD